MSEIPEDIQKSVATIIYQTRTMRPGTDVVATLRREVSELILTERQRCADIAKAHDAFLIFHEIINPNEKPAT